MTDAIPLPPELLAYAALMEAGKFYEAHEALEDLWAMDPTRTRELWKGLIMLAGALHHWRCGRRRPAHVLWEGAAARLRRYPPRVEGVALAPLREWAQAEFARYSTDDAPPPAPPSGVLADAESPRPLVSAAVPSPRRPIP
jgi:hypothetical protein